MSEKLNHYLKAWNLSNPRPLAQTVTSHVYTVLSGDERVVLKLLTPIGKEEASGAVALCCYDGHGAVRLFRADEDAQLLEYVEGDDLTALVENGEDEKATHIIAEVLNKLHSASRRSATQPPELTPLSRWFRDLLSKAEADRRSGSNSVYVRAAAIAEELLADPREICVLHGDIHHENIRHHAQRGWLAFDPKGLVGERTYDTANTLCNPVNIPALVHDEARLLKNAEILAQRLEIDLSRILNFAFVYVCLSASWMLSDGQDPSYALRIAEIVEPHLCR